MKLCYELAPSILSADFKRLGEQLEATERGGARYIHFDVMDGLFVPSISFGMPVLSSIHGATDQVMDVHLMIKDPIRYVEAFHKAGADILTFHYEACDDPGAVIAAIRENEMRVGISIKPATPVSVLEPLIRQIDMVLVMSVEPGFGGQAFIEDSFQKIRDIRRMAHDAGVNLDIEVDGGIYHENVEKVLEAGANIIVSGSGVFKGDVEDNARIFMEKIKKYERK